MLHISMVLLKVRGEIALLKRHLIILRLLGKKGPLGIIKLSHLIKISPSQVRYSLRVLQEYGLLQPTTKGAKVNQKAIGFINNLEVEKKKLSKLLAEI